MPKTFQQLRDELRAQIWVGNEAENLFEAHNYHFQEALGEIAEWVEGERQNNVNVVEFCKSFFKCGLTVVPAPKGIIQRLYTVANNDFCDPVFYRQRSYEWLLSWAQQLVGIVQANQAASLPLGFSPSDASTDSVLGRSRQGYWAIYRGNIYIGPWLQSMESVVIEWDGVKEEWQPNDLVSNSQLYRKAVKLYVQHAHERDFGSAERAQFFKQGDGERRGGFDEALADLMRKDREETKERPDQPVMSRPSGGWLAPLWLEKGLPPGPEAPSVFAHLGNFYGEMLWAAPVVRNMSPEVIIAAGLIAGAPTDSYDDTVGQWFHDFLEPYLGVKGLGSESGNAFWPAAAATDWSKDKCATWKAWFPTGQKTHYARCFGAVEFFFLSSSSFEPDGNWQSSQQAKLFQVQLAMSTAAWKVVVMADCAYGSVHQEPILQWPFKNWGVHLVLSSGAVNYERLDVNGLAVINNGLGGGGAIEPVTTPDASTVFTYAAGRGAGKITASETSLQYDFLDVAGAVVDSLVIKH